MLPIFRFALTALFGLTFIASANAQSSTAAPQAALDTPAITSTINENDARAKRIDTLVSTMVEKGIVPGASVLIQSDGKEVYFNTFGAQDREAKTPFSRDTIARIYSMTKPITAVGLMMLFDEGKFQLDDPLAKHLTEFADVKVYAGQSEDGEPILIAPTRAPTVRDVLRHTAGFTYGVFSETPVDMMYRDKDIIGYTHSNQEFSESLATLPLLVQPGTQWIYSVSSDVQGRLIEVLSGQSLGDFFQARIFTPLGMKDSGFTVPEDQQARFGPVYQLTKEGPARLDDENQFMANKPFLTDMAFESGGGGLVSTIDDYMRFALMLQNQGELDGKRLISKDTLDMMRADQLHGINPGSMGKGMSYGLGFGVVTDKTNETAYAPGTFHWGGLAGTKFFVDPANNLTVVFFTQLIGQDAIKLHDQLSFAIYGPPASQ